MGKEDPTKSEEAPTAEDIAKQEVVLKRRLTRLENPKLQREAKLNRIDSLMEDFAGSLSKTLNDIYEIIGKQGQVVRKIESLYKPPVTADSSEQERELRDEYDGLEADKQQLRSQLTLQFSEDVSSKDWRGLRKRAGFKAMLKAAHEHKMDITYLESSEEDSESIIGGRILGVEFQDETVRRDAQVLRMRYKKPRIWRTLVGPSELSEDGSLK